MLALNSREKQVQEHIQSSPAGLDGSTGQSQNSAAKKVCGPRRSEPAKPTTPFKDTTTGAIYEPQNICSNYDCVSNTKCTYRHSDDSREICGLYHPTCDCPSTENADAEAWFEREMREIVRDADMESREEMVNEGYEQADQTGEGCMTVRDSEPCEE